MTEAQEGFQEQQPIMEYYDELRKSSLFKDDEIRDIINQRRNFDYCIEKQLKSVRDFVEYIKFERQLLSKIKERRKSQNIVDFKLNLDYSIANKIIKLYKSALVKYPQEYGLYENFFKFCKVCKRTSEVPPYLSKLIEHHGNTSEDAWVRIVMWEYIESKNLDRARAFASNGLRLHPLSQALYLTLFRIELTEASKLVTHQIIITDGIESAQSLTLKRANDLYKHSKMSLHNVEFLINLLNLTEEFPFSLILQDEIIHDMMDLFPGNELTWHTIAQRELKGLAVKDVGNAEVQNAQFYSCSDPDTKGNADLMLNKLTSKRRIEICAKIYNKAAETIKTQKMWTFYIDAMIELNKDQSTQPALKRKCLLIAYCGGHDASCLTEDQYLQYIELLVSPEEAKESGHLLFAVLHRATSIYSESIELWKLYMKYYIVRCDKINVVDTFDTAIKKIGSNSLPLWQLLKRCYYVLDTKPSANPEAYHVVKLFERAIKEPEPISSIFRVEYIEWSALMRGITETRRLFYRLIDAENSGKHTRCFDMYKKMLKLNMKLLSNERFISNSENVEEAKRCFQIALENFGKTEPDLWIDFIKFERDYGETKNINDIYERAKKTMEDEHLIDAFTSQYYLIKNIL